MFSGSSAVVSAGLQLLAETLGDAGFDVAALTMSRIFSPQKAAGHIFSQSEKIQRVSSKSPDGLFCC
eukprot:superscaffoldBa00009197_g23927